MSVDNGAATGQSVLARIAKRNQDRQAKEQKRKLAIAREQEIAGESVSDFTAKLTKMRLKVESSLDPKEIKKVKKVDLPQYFDAVVSAICDIQRYAADSYFFLPPYEVQQAFLTVSKLQSSLTAAKAQFCPRRKFRFTKRIKKKGITKAEKIRDPKASASGEAESESTMLTIQAKSECKLTISKEDLKNNTNVKITKITSSEVYILQAISTLRLTDLKSTTVYVGPVSGPIYVERCQTHACSFYLWVSSKPIIEDCSSIGVGIYTVDYPLKEKHFKAGGFNEGVNYWDKVQDFNWLKQQQSPNWHVIKKEETKSPPSLINSHQ